MSTRSPAFVGAACAIAAVLSFSLNDSVIKALSGDYALHQVVLIRSSLGLLFILTIIAPFTGGFAVFRTQRLPMHLFRGFCVVTANMTFFLGLAAMPLADTVAIFFVSPLVITLFSVLFLGETVGPRRWGAVLAGLLGVLIIVQPGSSAFQTAALLPLIAAVAYAAIHIITRRIGATESATTMAVYIQIVFIVVSGCIGLAIGDGRFANQSDPSLAFLFRGWGWPPSSDYLYFAVLGVGIGLGGYLISQAYRVAEAAFVAPFEYLAMPLAVLWGWLFFNEIPSIRTVVGAVLIVGAGLFTVWREARTGQTMRKGRR